MTRPHLAHFHVAALVRGCCGRVNFVVEAFDITLSRLRAVLGLSFYKQVTRLATTNMAGLLGGRSARGRPAMLGFLPIRQIWRKHHHDDRRSGLCPAERLEIFRLPENGCEHCQHRSFQIST